ncbi:outer membrane protein [Rickettsia endosymbiont of Orchestes rusci]|uniref:outer membrane protein n=1 Tax=Rickettsia endosymbiont of Orchestes rusci TaxID=3066250 RepID=UPI00313B1934
MKKLLLIAAASATILSSTLSFADCAMDTNQSQNENKWYLKANAGAIIFDKAKDGSTGVKMKSSTAFTGSIGAGYYIMENVRTDLTLGTIASGQLKKTAIVTTGRYNGSTASVKHKLNNFANLLLNGYVDFVDVSMFKLFAGAGIGVASLQDKITWTVNNVTASTSSKKTYNFAWQASLGASAEVADGVKAELVYSYLDNGKTKSKNVQFENTTFQTGSTRYKGNSLTAGIRFDI